MSVSNDFAAKVHYRIGKTFRGRPQNKRLANPRELYVIGHVPNNYSIWRASRYDAGFASEGGGFRRGQDSQHFDSKGQDVEIEMPVFLEETIADTQKSIEFQIPVRKEGISSYLKKRLNVKIPRGVADGERIRLKGQGAPSIGGGDPGDLYCHIRLVPHPLFDAQGNNLIITVPIAPWEAVLGAKITVPTLDGSINLTLAANSQTGKKLRVKGKGLPGKTGTGDLYAVLKIVIPPSSNEAALTLWRNLSTTTDFDPRSEWSEQERGKKT